MVQILGGKLLREDVTSTARGGTELIAEEMVKRLDPDLLSGFQIVHSRVRELDMSKKRIWVAHDLPGDPESNFLANGGYNKFDKLVFVSNWQMQRYIDHYGLPWYKCNVIQNAINPLEKRLERQPEATQAVKLVYHTTPHRGLHILANAFSNIAAEDDSVTLDVFSSFKIYGWEQRDQEYEGLFNFLREHPKVNYHGSVPHEEVVEALPTFDIFAYPSIWPETSCISLMEAMSAGLLCIHPNYAALYETAANWTWMYQFQDDERDHTKTFYQVLRTGIAAIRAGGVENRLHNQSVYTDMFNSWDLRAVQWEQFLRSI